MIRTERLEMTPLSPADWPDYCGFLTSDRSRFLGGPRPRAEAWRGFATELGHWQIRGYGKFSVALRTGSRIGAIGPWYPEGWPEPEIGFFLWSGYEGKGYAAEAVRAALGYARKTLRWENVVSYIHPLNERAQRFAWSLGCQRDDTAAQRADRVTFRHASSGTATGDLS